MQTKKEIDSTSMKLKTQLTMVSILVRDQDEALHFYTEKLGLEKRADVAFGPGMRLLTVAPRGQKKPEIALAKPDSALHNADRVNELMEHIGQGVPWIFDTNDCCKTYELLLARGVKFVSEPTRQFYGVEAVFEDPSGNTFSLLEASPEARSLLKNRSVGTAA
jgi:catechol 2,3-dioxygenase-like lactoylglutathione lyase family enzyme